MGLFHSNSSKYANPADSAMPYLQEIPGTVSPYYNPYINLGKGAARVSAPIYYNMATNPQGYYNDIMSGYQPSDQYQYNQQQLMGQQQAAAASGGFTGTSYDQMQQAQGTQGLLSQDEQQYYNNVTGAQNRGLNAGMDYFNTGYNASNTLANMLGQNLAAEAGLSYQGTAFEDQMQAQQAQNRMGLLGTTLGVTGGYFGSRSSPSNSYYGYDTNSSPSVSGYSPRYG